MPLLLARFSSLLRGADRQGPGRHAAPRGQADVYARRAAGGAGLGRYCGAGWCSSGVVLALLQNDALCCQLLKLC